MSAEITLAAVREIPERWHHRPAARVLRCIPIKTCELKPLTLVEVVLARLLFNSSMRKTAHV